MSYSPTTWSTGDTITASAMNKIENGIANAGSVATVIVNFNDGGLVGSVACIVAYAQYISVRDIYSIESNMVDYYGVAPYQGRLYIPVCVPSSTDDFKAYIFFNDAIDSMSGYTVTGNISATKITGNVRASSTTWHSTPYYGFEVTGDGEIDVWYND